MLLVVLIKMRPVGVRKNGDGTRIEANHNLITSHLNTISALWLFVILTNQMLPRVQFGP
jgi:hypothetical protein